MSKNLDLDDVCSGHPVATEELLTLRESRDALRQVAAEAYQVIGSLADKFDAFGMPCVQRALDYFIAIANLGMLPDELDAILPWEVE